MKNRFPTYLFLSFLSFLRHLFGVFFNPYQTYRELVKFKFPLESLFIGILVVGYIGLAAILKKGFDSGPLLLTLHFSKIFWGIFFSFVIFWGLLYFIGRFVGGRGTPQSLFLPWIYSLIPTVLWFLITSLLYFFLPPPRSNTLRGQLFSLFFIAFSTAVFYWKAVLYYLTLRFGHGLDLKRILITTLILFPLLLVYSLFTYKLGLFRVPFI